SDAAAIPARRSWIGTLSQPWSLAYLSSAATPASSTSMPTLTGTLPVVNQRFTARTATSNGSGRTGRAGCGGRGGAGGSGGGSDADGSGALGDSAVPETLSGAAACASGGARQAAGSGWTEGNSCTTVGCGAGASLDASR